MSKRIIFLTEFWLNCNSRQIAAAFDSVERAMECAAWLAAGCGRFRVSSEMQRVAERLWANDSCEFVMVSKLEVS